MNQWLWIEMAKILKKYIHEKKLEYNKINRIIIERKEKIEKAKKKMNFAKKKKKNNVAKNVEGMLRKQSEGKKEERKRIIDK